MHRSKFVHSANWIAKWSPKSILGLFRSAMDPQFTEWFYGRISGREISLSKSFLLIMQRICGPVSYSMVTHCSGHTLDRKITLKIELHLTCSAIIPRLGEQICGRIIDCRIAIYCKSFYQLHNASQVHICLPWNHKTLSPWRTFTGPYR